MLPSRNFVAKHWQSGGFGIVSVGAEFRRDETLYACGDGGVDDERLALETFVADSGDNCILAFEGGGERLQGVVVDGNGFDGGWEGGFG
jgi:hypothetical protein